MSATKPAKPAKIEWVAKNVDVDPRDWAMVRIAAAVAATEVREWVRAAIREKLKRTHSMGR